jgi:WD40 repeat protein
MKNQEALSLRGHTVSVTSLAFSPDGHLLATAGDNDRSVRVWSARPVAEIPDGAEE